MKSEAAFWAAVGITAILAVAGFKLVAAQPWFPESGKRLAGFI
jgi:hypothetical protein